MASETAVVFLVSTGMAATLAVGFSLPKLTENGVGKSRSSEVQAHIDGEASFCRSGGPSVNCTCFAQKSGYIISYDKPRIRHANYPDRVTLARGQAAQNC